MVDDRSKLIGALTVDAVVDYIEARADIRALQSAGLRGEEDLFSSVWDSARNRCLLWYKGNSGQYNWPYPTSILLIAHRTGEWCG